MPNFQFRLPIRDDLTRLQRLAIDDDKPIFTTGVPGSGKTVVAIYRIARLKNRSRLFTYTRMLTVAINGSVNEHLRDASNRVSSVYEWFARNCNLRLTDYIESKELLTEKLIDYNISFSELIFDEAQDLPITLYNAFKEICNNISIGADNAQKVFLGSTEEDLRKIFCLNNPHELDENHRNTYEIFNFARHFVPENERAQNANMLQLLNLKRRGDKPTIFTFKNIHDIFETFKDIIKDNIGGNIGVLLLHTNEVKTYYNIIRNELKFDCSYYYSGMPTSDRDSVERNLKSILVTTFKSAKGMEFDTVIIPELQMIDDEFKTQYFVGCTRARGNLFLFSKNSLPHFIESNFIEDSYTLETISTKTLPINPIEMDNIIDLDDLPF